MTTNGQLCHIFLSQASLSGRRISVSVLVRVMITLGENEVGIASGVSISCGLAGVFGTVSWSGMTLRWDQLRSAYQFGASTTLWSGPSCCRPHCTSDRFILSSDPNIGERSRARCQLLNYRCWAALCLSFISLMSLRHSSPTWIFCSVSC